MGVGQWWQLYPSAPENKQLWYDVTLLCTVRLCPIHTADADATSCRRRDKTRRCEHTRRQSWPSLQFPVLTTDKLRHNDVIVEKIVKIHEYYTTQQIRMFTNMQRHMLRHILLLEHWLQNCKVGHGHRLRSHHRIRRQSSWASCEFIYTPPTPTRREETVSSRRRCVLGFTLLSRHYILDCNSNKYICHSSDSTAIYKCMD